MVHMYRPDIDGLRAVAVTSIVLFHAKFATFVAGGFAGVDIFFVISGYLITRAIQDELVVGDFSLIRFYFKRIRRICPALLVMLFACTGIAAMAISPQELKSYGTYLTSSALFVSNILYAKQIDYFAPASEQIPLLHTWSLSVEEQFYLLWPLTLVLAWRASQSVLVILAIAAGSFAYSVLFMPTAPTKVFYLLPFRAWQLALGALLATPVVRSISFRAPRAACEVASAAGLTVIGIVVLFDPSPVGLAGVLPCLGAALIIAAGEHRTPLGNHILQSRPFVFIGLISYSLYLWHWPVLTFGRYLLEVNAAGRLGLVVLATGLAFLSWRYVEQPARAIALTTNEGRRLIGAALVAVAVLAGIGTTLRVSKWRIEPAVILAQQEAMRFYRSNCLARSESIPDGCLLGAPSEAPGDYRAILWGEFARSTIRPRHGRNRSASSPDDQAGHRRRLSATARRHISPNA